MQTEDPAKTDDIVSSFSKAVLDENGLVPPLFRQLVAYLQGQYSGIFDARRLKQHIHDYVFLNGATSYLERVRAESNPKKLLDIGCGFGSFVTRARLCGIEAHGVDIAQYEIEFARGRLKRLAPEVQGECFHIASAYSLPFEGASFDVVTLWNVLEHVEDPVQVITEAKRVLKPHGRIYIELPNYMAFRQEAHYHVFWPPFFRKSLGAAYLRFRGRNPQFLIDSVFYRTNAEMHKLIKASGLSIVDPWEAKINRPEMVTRPLVRKVLRGIKRMHLARLLRLLLLASQKNPFKHSITLTISKSH